MPVIPDTLKPVGDSITYVVDSLISTSDSISLVSDTIGVDSVSLLSEKKSSLDAKVDYKSADSLRFDIKRQRMYLYNLGDITYGDINLKANYIEIDFPKNMIYAHGSRDSLDKEIGVPEFTQGDMQFKSKVMNYNYKTKKGYIRRVFTQQDEGYLHGQVVKKMADDVTYIKQGS